MTEEITKLLYDYSANYYLADIDFVNKIIEIILDEKGLNEYIKESKIITFENIDDKDNIYGSEYNPTTKQLEIDATSKGYIFNHTSNEKKKVLEYNIEVVLTILHELQHVQSEKSGQISLNEFEMYNYRLSHENDNSPLEIIKSDEFKEMTNEEKEKVSFDLVNYCITNQMIDSFYNMYHDLYPLERIAHINSNIELKEIISNLSNTSINKNKIKKLEKKYLLQIKKYIKYGYHLNINFKTNSPSIEYYEKLYSQIDSNEHNKELEENLKNYNYSKDKFTLQERIIYGLPLSFDEYRSINNKEEIYKNIKKLY